MPESNALVADITEMTREDLVMEGPDDVPEVNTATAGVGCQATLTMCVATHKG